MMSSHFEGDVLACLKVLREGGLILYPTDTIWGIGCDATNEAAVERIFKLKDRPGQKAMVVLLAEARDIFHYTASPDPEIFDHLENFTRPTTIIFKNALGLAKNLIAADGSIAIRICKDEFCTHLLKRFRKPLVSTSANLSGSPSPVNFKSIDPVIINGVDWVVKHRQNEDEMAAPSDIVSWVNGALVRLRG